MSDEFRRKRKLTTRDNITRLCGWGPWIRTKIDGVRDRCSTVLVAEQSVECDSLDQPRLSAAGRPGSPGLPGRRGAIRSHCESFNTLRIKADLHFSALNQISQQRGIPLKQKYVHRP